jgi:hypothetical protein
LDVLFSWLWHWSNLANLLKHFAKNYDEGNLPIDCLLYGVLFDDRIWATTRDKIRAAVFKYGRQIGKTSVQHIDIN